MIAESYFDKWLIDALTRQCSGYNRTFTLRLFNFLSGQYKFLSCEKYYSKGKKFKWVGDGFNYVVVLNSTAIEYEYLSAFDENIRNNPTYSVHRDSAYYYIFVDSDEDLNFLRLIVNKEDYLAFNIRDLNKKIRT